MSQPSDFAESNLLLKAMAADDLALLSPHLERVEMERGSVLVAAGKAIEHVYFPEGGIASVVSDLPDTGPTEVGIFGREGMSSVDALLGSDSSTTRTFMQVDGSTSLRIELAYFRAAIGQSLSLQALLLRYVQIVMIQLTQSVVTNAHHRMEARLARWLLMCHDRIDGDEVNLTHEFMSMMLAVQRTGVTVSLHILEGGGSIRSKRGRVIILDRERLEELAGDAYGIPEAEYRRLIGPFGRGDGSIRLTLSPSPSYP